MRQVRAGIGDERSKTVQGGGGLATLVGDGVEEVGVGAVVGLGDSLGVGFARGALVNWHSHLCLLKYWTSRSCFSAASRVVKVPRFLRFPVLVFNFREYKR